MESCRCGWRAFAHKIDQPSPPEDDSMPASFTCSICGKEHEGLTTDWGYQLPDVVWAVPAEERSAAARYGDDLCQFGDRCFIRCVLPVRFLETEGEFGWGAWAEVERSTFNRYVELFDNNGSAEPRHAGTLANALPVYGDSLDASVLIQFGEPTKRPTLHLLNGDDSLLAREQRCGIDNARYHEILDALSNR
jgi:hypothetical protein